MKLNKLLMIVSLLGLLFFTLDISIVNWNVRRYVIIRNSWGKIVIAVLFFLTFSYFLIKNKNDGKK